MVSHFVLPILPTALVRPLNPSVRPTAHTGATDGLAIMSTSVERAMRASARAPILIRCAATRRSATAALHDAKRGALWRVNASVRSAAAASPAQLRARRALPRPPSRRLTRSKHLSPYAEPRRCRPATKNISARLRQSCVRWSMLRGRATMTCASSLGKSPAAYRPRCRAHRRCHPRCRHRPRRRPRHACLSVRSAEARPGRAQPAAAKGPRRAMRRVSAGSFTRHSPAVARWMYER